MQRRSRKTGDRRSPAARRAPGAGAHDPVILGPQIAGARLGAVDKQAVVPLYHQVFERLRDGIISGTYSAGDRLPSEREICEAFGVSRITAQKAFERLAQEGLVIRRRGIGSLVADRPNLPAMSGDMQALLENVTVIAAATTGRLVELVEVSLNEEIRREMQLGRGTKAQRSVHLRLRDGMPLGLIVAWVPVALARGITAEDIEHTPMISLLEGRGMHPSWAVQSIGATVADARQADLLGVTAGAPLVRLKRIVYDRRDRPIEHLTAFYRADRYEYRTVLRRDAPRRHAERGPASRRPVGDDK